jgi:hypothetical protein
MATFRNKHFTKRDYEATNIVACVSASAPNDNYVPADDSILFGLTSLWLERVNGQEVRFYGYL